MAYNQEAIKSCMGYLNENLFELISSLGELFGQAFPLAQIFEFGVLVSVATKSFVLFGSETYLLY